MVVYILRFRVPFSVFWFACPPLVLARPRAVLLAPRAPEKQRVPSSPGRSGSGHGAWALDGCPGLSFRPFPFTQTPKPNLAAG